MWKTWGYARLPPNLVQGIDKKLELLGTQRD